jgi:hypothetical protein
LVNTPPVAKSIMMKNIKFFNIFIEGSMDLLNTQSFTYDYDLTILFINMTFQNITFARNGNLMNLQHRLTNHVIIQDSHFSDIFSAGVVIGTSTTQDSDLLTGVKIINSTFRDFSSSSGSFISAYKGAVVEIDN